jgi:hypothetical protein
MLSILLYICATRRVYAPAKKKTGRLFGDVHQNKFIARDAEHTAVLQAFCHATQNTREMWGRPHCLKSGGLELDYVASETRVKSETSEQSCICPWDRRGLAGGVEQRIARRCLADR